MQSIIPPVIAVVSFALSGAVFAALITITGAIEEESDHAWTPATAPVPAPDPVPAQATVVPTEITAASEPRWWVRVGLLERRPLQRVDLGQGVICQSQTGSQQQLFKPQIEAGLRAGSLPPLLCTGGWIHLNGVGYWGRLEIERSELDWLAIHTVELERYVASVVGAEMPSSWPSQALKAQAIAARSYALTHLIRPATQRYHLGDSTRWQAYRGASSRSAAASRATHGTRGIILSQDERVVESLYAATHAIADVAHRHLGASMSQTGARDLAERGLTYPAILAHFYPGTQLKTLRRDDD